MNRILILCGLLMAAMNLFPAIASASDPGKPDLIIMDSIQVKPGGSAVMSVKVIADDSTFYNKKNWLGVGSFCLPLKYDKKALIVDSTKFAGVVSEWDEKFTNARIDTGFVSFAGIYNIAGADNPVVFSPEKQHEFIQIFVRVDKAAKPGTYLFELTSDPIQDEAYLGSIDGYNSWKPGFVAGKVVVTP
jgi:hypothetical protein